MSIPIWQRLISILFYLIPWSQAIPFGNNLFYQYPFLEVFIFPTIPIIIIEQLIPFGSLLLFLLIFIGIIRNPKINYFLRFNALQALLLNIGIILISFGFQIILKSFAAGLLVRTISTTILVGVFSIVLFSISECLKGKEPDLPGISNSVRIQL